MKRATLVSMLLPGVCLLLTGCFSTVRNVQKTERPPVFRSETIEQLEQTVSDRDAAIKTLNAQVLITASTGGGKEGKVTEYTSFRGYIFVRKPQNLRVLLQLPVIGSRALDMVSDGKTFTLLIPPKNRAIMGTNEVTKPSKNGLENLRPAVFFDSLLVPGVGTDEFVGVTESTRVLEMTIGKRHTAIEEPDYDVTISKHKDGNVLQTLRVIHINRIDGLPFQQDIYDEQGRIVTQAMYAKYQPFADVQFPSLVTITRPLDEYSLKVEITKLIINGPLEDDQFELKIPAGVPIEKME